MLGAIVGIILLIFVTENKDSNRSRLLQKYYYLSWYFRVYLEFLIQSLVRSKDFKAVTFQ